MIFLSFFIAIISAFILHPQVVKVAKLKGITDNPGSRKLQRHPVPVLGGIVVFSSIIIGIGFTTWFVTYTGFLLIIALMLIMLITGTLDDIIELTPVSRFVIEVLVAVALLTLGGMEIDNFHGLWGIDTISPIIYVPLTIIAVVGIINAINLIDGVDGLSSGYGIMSCSLFAWYFFTEGDAAMTALSLSAAGALIPFFIFNVFGHKQKMFIGDGGTLLMGLILSIFVLKIFTSNFTPIDAAPIHPDPDVASLRQPHFGLVPFALAILSMPVCDTLRVMIMRIVRKQSPFNPDKTHLHHAFICIGMTHLQASLSILALNAFIILLWNILYILGASIDTQFYTVVGTTIVLNCTIYRYCTTHPKKTE